MIKNPPANAGGIRDAGTTPGWEAPVEEGMETHPSTLAWRMPWAEGPGGIQPMGSRLACLCTVGRYAHTAVCFSWKEVVVSLEGVPAPLLSPFSVSCCLSPEAAPCHRRRRLSAECPQRTRGAGGRLRPPTQPEGREMCVKRMEFPAGSLLTRSCLILGLAPSRPEAPPCCAY